MTSKNTLNMIPLVSVMPDIIRLTGENSSMSEDDLLESAASASMHLYNYKFYENALFIDCIDNFSMMIPDYSQVVAVFYKSDLVASELDDIVQTVQVDLTDSKVTNPSSPIQKESYTTSPFGKISKKTVHRCKRKAMDYGWKHMTLGHSVMNMYQVALAQKTYEECMSNISLCSPTSLGHKPVKDSRCNCGGTCLGNCKGKTVCTEITTIDNCTQESCTQIINETSISAETQCKKNLKDMMYDICSSCGDYTYSIKGNKITFSQATGFAMVIYKRICTDDEGGILIPDHPLANEAIKAYVMMEYTEREAITHTQGSFRLYRHYLDKWERLSAAAGGELVKPSLPEYVEMAKLNKMFKGNNGSSIYDNVQTEHINLGLTNSGYGRY